MKYLYGASVQGIQGFVFATNRLREIIGASDIVEDISINFFYKILEDSGIDTGAYTVIVMAAGNVRLLFERKDDVQKLFEVAPKRVMQRAYGITLSQAAVEVKDGLDRKTIDRLEKKLKAARNRAMIPLDASLNATYIAPRTARAAAGTIKVQKDRETVDRATLQKDRAADEGKNRLLEAIGIDTQNGELVKKFPDDMGAMSNSKNKIAVIHADGNGLGMILQKIAEALEQRPEVMESVYTDFSKALDEATKSAVKKAYDESFNEEKDGKIRFRPVVLGGDDVTVICDADRSLSFTEKFMRYFEEETKSRIGKIGNKHKIEEIRKGLSVCTGIAYCNEKFPFHYAVSLAEALCAEAKRASKNIDRELPPSSLMFHNILSSHYDNFADYKERELTLCVPRESGDGDSCDKKIGLDFGPYFLHRDERTKDYPSVEAFREAASAFMAENSPIGKLRNWLDLLEESEEMADLALKRIAQMAEESGFDASSLNGLHEGLSLKEPIVEIDGFRKTPVYDILQIHSISGALQ